jgi:hypothetical protein
VTKSSRSLRKRIFFEGEVFVGAQVVNPEFQAPVRSHSPARLIAPALARFVHRIDPAAKGFPTTPFLLLSVADRVVAIVRRSGAMLRTARDKLNNYPVPFSPNGSRSMSARNPLELVLQIQLVFAIEFTI